MEPESVYSSERVGELATARNYANLASAVLALNAAWNAKDAEDVIAGHIDLCRRLALETVNIADMPRDQFLGLVEELKQGQQPAERDRFEHWYSDEGASPNAVMRATGDGAGYYLIGANLAWAAWQAALKAERERCHRVLATAPNSGKPSTALLTKPAQVAGGIFRAGVSERYVIEAAQRQYEIREAELLLTFDQRQDEERNRRLLWDTIWGSPVDQVAEAQKQNKPESPAVAQSDIALNATKLERRTAQIERTGEIERRIRTMTKEFIA